MIRLDHREGRGLVGTMIIVPECPAASSPRAGRRAAKALLAIRALALLAFVLLLGTASPAQAVDCSAFPNGVIDGDLVAAPSQLQINQNCTIRNFPASNPLSTNFSFFTQPGQTNERWLVIFDNVVHTGQMACNNVAGHKIWFTNGSSTTIQEDCQNLLIPVEKIDKQNPIGQTTASVGVPFTYTLTMPVLFDPATGGVINTSGSVNDLHGVTLSDDLNATGADLTYLSHVAYWQGGGGPVPHAFSNVGGLLSFSGFPIIPAGEQIVIEITVVLDDTPANSVGTQFINTAKWDFGRLIDGVFYEPLPGEWGVTPPLTIAAPELVVTKTGPATLGQTLNLGQFGQFALDVQNTGLSDAWNVTLLDRLPDGPTGGMCNLTPQVLSAQVFAADGVTPVPGKGPLVQGTDFSLSFTGVPTCELELTLLTAAAVIAPTERLILTYQTQLDAGSQDGATLTNVVGATEWFNGDSSNANRLTYTRTLTDGTVGLLDHQDAHTVTASLFGYFFEKSVENMTTGVSPTSTAAPGDSLRYTLRLQATDLALNNFTFSDDLGALNPGVVFEPGSLTLVTVPPGADIINTDPNGGSNGAGLLDVRNLNVPVNAEVLVQFDITVAASVVDGVVVTNQADLLSGVVKLADSDDPNVNGQADPNVAGDEDPTQVLVETIPPEALAKANTQATAAIGDEFRYQVTVPSVVHTAPLYDVRIIDDLGLSAADLVFVDVTKISVSGSWVPVNTGTPKSLVIEDPVNGIDIPAGEQIVVEITVRLEDTAANVTGLPFTNTASYLYNLADGDNGSQRPGLPGTTAPMTIVGADQVTLSKTGPATLTIGTPGTFALEIQNASTGAAWNLTITDQLAETPTGGTCDVAPSQLTAQLFESDGVTPASPLLVDGTDFSAVFMPSPICRLSISILTAAGTIGPDQRLRVGYATELDADSQEGAILTNVAGATEWFSADSQASGRRTYARTITDGTVGTLDHEDAHSLLVARPAYFFEKSVVNVTRSTDPGSVASPGDTLRYRIRIENLRATPLNNLRVLDELDSLNATPMFQPGSFSLVTTPAGADIINTSSTGGAAGTGLLDVRNLNLPGLNDSAVIEFEILLATVLPNLSLATNQSELFLDTISFAYSDDPNVNGQADPFVPGDEDPTRVLIESSPVFRVEKISSDLTGSPSVLLAGETLQYTITVKNVGTDDAIDTILRDAIPANTQYVAGSTTLNGAPVPDGASGVAPLSTGILISAPENPTPGAMRADPSSTLTNVATLVFEVVVDPGAIDGTVISNQSFVSAIQGGVSDQPSDDPGTAVVDDPTRNVVGSLPLLFATKDVVLQGDAGTAGVVDPGDVLRYTITVYNNGTVPATQVTLTDAVPANTIYFDDSLTLNGLPVGQPNGGVSPLVAGIPISSSDLTPPLPLAGQGTLSPGETAVIVFDLTVDPAALRGTIISNQAVVGSLELSDVLTDGDGNPATGPEPTLVVVGDGQALSITKQLTVVGGGAALAGSELEYVVTVVNIATVPAFDVLIADDLAAPVANQLAYVDPSATLNGSTAGITVTGSVIEADYFGTYGELQPGETAVLRFRATLDPGLALGTTVTNTGVVTWDAASQVAMASVSVDVGGVPGVGVLNGTLWHDADFDRAVGGTERLLDAWSVELLRNGQLVQSVLTDPAGTFRLSGLPPNDLNGDQYALRFVAPGAGARTASLGRGDSPFTNGPQQISDIMVSSGGNLQGLNLPIDPNGVVYDSIQRIPVAGALVNMLAAGTGTALPSQCFDDPTQQGQTTLGDGYYKFDLNFSDATCFSGASYRVVVTPPGSTFVTGISQIIPPSTPAPLSVPACPGSVNDAVPSTSLHCEAQTSELAPAASVPPRTAGTSYFLDLVLNNSQLPGSSQIFNNHIPLDPVLTGAVAITKTTSKVNVSRGELVPYAITFSNELGIAFPDLTLVDRFPAGFHYVENSAKVDGVSVEPAIDGRDLTWTDLGIAPDSRRRIALLLAVGAGVGDGEYTNRAYAVSSFNGAALSGQANATVRVVPDPTFDCTDVLGKVFDDKNRNGAQDRGEGGLQGVKLATARGLVATTDRYGRFHITCAVVPRDGRGTNFVLKLDDRSLPSGYRLSTRQTQVKRATRGRALRFNYGASIHRVVSLDMANSVFEPGSTEMREQWRPRLGMLIDELKKAPAVLRLSYVADLEGSSLVDDRLEAVKQEIIQAWGEFDGYSLTIETEIFWHRGAPVDRPSAHLPQASPSGLPAVSAGPPVEEAKPGEAVERHLPTAPPMTQWTQDSGLLETEEGDRLEEREVVAQDVETVKLADVVPPVRFESGAAGISPSYIARLREVLESMQHLRNVRLHLIGHADDQPLSGALERMYGDNAGLSRERAGEVAEFLKTALGLPPDAVSFEWAGESQPVASNATPEGRAKNRRVEVEVWYDEVEERLALEEFVVSEDIKRVKICRLETVCKLRYKEGHAHRARVKNLIAPLRVDDETVGVSRDFVSQIRQALHNLRGKENVTVKFVGFTDDVPLTGRAERIYGTHLSLSKARARRVALAVKESLDLPSAAVDSDGRGASRPVASNDTTRGRALNRRVEVEFWHDDPLQELSDEPQLCPAAASAETVTRVYDPPWGRLPPIPIEDGQAQVPSGYADQVRRAMADVVNETNVRLRFIGYTRNERLDRRTALAYGDDIGLSAARARKTMRMMRSELSLSDELTEHEGRGYIHSNDVVNAGFVQGDSSYVVAQVVYDELAVLDDYEGVAVTPITRELSARDPLELNLMRISVDGKPIDDSSRSSADIQRCTDVALERADIQFHFDNLESEARLSVSVSPTTVSVRLPSAAPPAVPEAPGNAESTEAAETKEPIGTAEALGAPAGGALAPDAPIVRFRMYSNYAHFIERSEVRIFDQERSLQAPPLAVVEMDSEGLAEWRPGPERFAAPTRLLKFVLRAYDAEGHFDQTAPQQLWMVHGDPEGDWARVRPSTAGQPGKDPLLAGYGETGPVARSIPLDNAGTVKVQGSGIPANHQVWVAGSRVPVDEHGSFVADAVLPEGLHTVEVAVLDEVGNGELFLRDLELDQDDWFYVGIADVTLSARSKSGSVNALQGKKSRYDDDSWADGRLAFYLTGKFAEDWRLTASADTREEEVTDLFSNFLDKSPDALFRRIDPDYHYPTFGDDSTVEEMAPTSGKLYVKLAKDQSHAMWGNFHVGYVQNELAQVDRGLYGANLHYQSLATTELGEQRVMVDGFAANPGTVSSREDFRGTGGSLYFLRRQDVMTGSERVRIETRDKDSGMVTGVVHLQPSLDYDVDYLQGRILLAEALESTVADGLVVRSQGLSGDEVWLVVQYEYSPTFDELDSLTFGGQGHVWLNDYVKVGATANRDDEGSNSTLYAGDVTVRKSTESWVKFQVGRSEGLVGTTLRSDNGGFNFLGTGDLGLENADAQAYRADVSVGFGDFLDGGRGRFSFYGQRQEAGYSAPGMIALTDTDQYGGTLEMPVIEGLNLKAKADREVQDDGLTTTAADLNVDYELTDRWSMRAGVRHERRDDDSQVQAATQDEGDRTDGAVEVAYDSLGSWRGYGFGQATLASTGDRDDNKRVGVGGAYRVSDRFVVDGEVSHGDLGPAVKLGTSYQESEDTHRYFSYTLENERGVDGVHARRGTVISGMRTRLADSGSVYMEDRYQHTDSGNGLARSMGITLAPADHWSLAANWELGSLFDRETNAETKRRAGGGSIGYGSEDLRASVGIEYLYDKTEQPDKTKSNRTTWLFRNSAKYQATPSVRILGKYNHSFSDSSLGDFYDGGYTEGVVGFAYRPVTHDKLNVLAKYTYFYNVPTTDQVILVDTPVEYIQKSHIAALDLSYDLTKRVTIGGKYAYRRGEVSLDRKDKKFFSNDAHLYILRGDWRVTDNWEGSLEGRSLHLPDLDERRSGALVTVYRYLGKHFKVGIGYNFTDFSDDLTDLSYDDHGVFFNLIGTL